MTIVEKIKHMQAHGWNIPRIAKECGIEKGRLIALRYYPDRQYKIRPGEEGALSEGVDRVNKIKSLADEIKSLERGE